MIYSKISNLVILLTLIVFSLNSCGMGADARKVPTNPNERVKRNIEAGKGFRLMDGVDRNKGGNFEFASSNSLWRASLDIIDFMPLASVNYSGGIIITDWYSTENNNKSIKISIRFLTNEVRSDALHIKVFNRNCNAQSNCTISEKTGPLTQDLNAKILKTAAIYEKNKKDKNFKPYSGKGFESPKK